MAITSNGTKVSLDASCVPSGYTLPTVTQVSGDELWLNRTSFVVAKSAVEGATAVIGFTALVAAVEAASLALVTDTYQAAEDVTFWTDFVAVADNQGPCLAESAYTTAVEEFTCTVTIHVQVVDVT